MAQAGTHQASAKPDSGSGRSGRSRLFTKLELARILDPDHFAEHRPVPDGALRLCVVCGLRPSPLGRRRCWACTGYRRRHGHDRVEEPGAATRRRLRVFLFLVASAGLTPRQIAAIEVEDIDQTAGTLLIDGPRGVPTVIPLHPLVMRLLHGLPLPKTGAVFRQEPAGGTGRRGAPVNPHNVSQAVNRHLHDVGVQATCLGLRFALRPGRQARPEDE